MGKEYYLYKSFRLQKVNTAQDLKQTANPFVSAAVLIGGLVIAGSLFLMNRAVTVADELALPASAQGISLEN